MNGTTLNVLLTALTSAFVELVVPPVDLTARIESVTLVDSDDLAAGAATAHLCLLVGVRADVAAAWLTGTLGQRPQAVMIKSVSEPLRQAAGAAGVAIVGVHAQARWDRLLPMIRRVLDSSDTPEPDTDLFGLAHTVATLTKGMVSIEDEHSHVLAYSASDEAADELRTLSILGREGPADYLRRLNEWGVYDSLRRSDDVIEVPPHDELGIRRRLVAGIRSSADGSVRMLGTIWIQEGQKPIADDATAVLHGATAVAARLITRIRDAPSNEALQIQRLLGAEGGSVDVPSLAASLSLPTSGPAAVVGFDHADAPLAASIRLRASSFHRESLVTTIGPRIYLLIPTIHSPDAVSSWVRGLVSGIESRSGVVLRAAVASPVADLTAVAAARAEVDRVLDGTTTERVTTLADSRTTVLLGEILDLVASRDDLHDPRLDALVAYDAKNSSEMRRSVEAYLDALGDVRAAADTLQIHPNTLRYRIRRVQKITGIDLSDPAARLLTAVQLAVLAR
ncbi:transcriptional regulator [Rhodococcoides trifolii]|uniref:Transcriptional regulator n=1 Tax=Rhodococcoides trifolii TaxID=908250 RepID=A0A917LHA7_9NOCA|nr:helix-turn-helix domain-containing protein [Rhodococcus trifolii]GGG23599.1 transcriptional regulator [Rhodococcus trifolii]